MARHADKIALALLCALLAAYVFFGVRAILRMRNEGRVLAGESRRLSTQAATNTFTPRVQDENQFLGRIRDQWLKPPEISALAGTAFYEPPAPAAPAHH